MNNEMVGNDKAEQDMNHPHRMVEPEAGGALGVFARRLVALAAHLSLEERMAVQGEYVDALVEAELADTARGFRQGQEDLVRRVTRTYGPSSGAALRALVEKP